MKFLGFFALLLGLNAYADGYILNSFCGNFKKVKDKKGHSLVIVKNGFIKYEAIAKNNGVVTTSLSHQYSKSGKAKITVKDGDLKRTMREKSSELAKGDSFCVASIAKFKGTDIYTTNYESKEIEFERDIVFPKQFIAKIKKNYNLD